MPGLKQKALQAEESNYGSENLLAVLPGVELEFPGEGSLKLIGGHRLWYAPEIPRRTYIPDGNPVRCSKTESGVVLKQNVEVSTGVEKKIEIIMEEDTASLKLVHSLSHS